MQWAALNDGGRVADPASAAAARVTSEAEESRLTSSYEAALYFIRDGNREDAARELAWMMTQVIEKGTGRRARLDGWQAAGKTGTTQAARDAWFVGFTAEYVAGVQPPTRR